MGLRFRLQLKLGKNITILCLSSTQVEGMITGPVVKVLTNKDGSVIKNKHGQVMTHLVSDVKFVDPTSDKNLGLKENEEWVSHGDPSVFLPTNSTQQMENLAIGDAASTSMTQQMNALNVNATDDDSSVASMVTVAEDPLLKSATEQKKIDDQEEIEKRCIELSRKNAMGRVILSAEPYNYWQD